MPEPPPPETLSWLRHAASCGQRDAQTMLHVLGRLDALEKKYETQRLATLEWGKDVDKLMRWIDDHLKRIMTLEQRPIPGTVELAAPTPEATPVADDDEPQTLHTIALRMVDTLEQLRVLPEILDTLRRAIREPMERPPAAQPAPPAAPAGGLVERVADAIVTKATSAGIVDDRPARAAIREVAAWLRENEIGYHAAHALEQEAGR